mgnify:CR=1 FL=1
MVDRVGAMTEDQISLGDRDKLVAEARFLRAMINFGLVCSWENIPLIKNSECSVHDIGDGVMCLEFQSKSNAIGEGIAKGILKAVEKAENENWKGLVIGNNAKQFSVGANLMNIGVLAMQKKYDTLDQMVYYFYYSLY